ncbi:Retrotransposon gag domain-containing 1 [Gossypium australe]|uniref:Retrotransposon gag domain-containing 1 n=1 Tax=Gossypium australe TaxID=47621 RepID=A0A5B6VLB4_9ROSI|nr:Retrotransposon gag domain-containing 1 [Gossypium australe]
MEFVRLNKSPVDKIRKHVAEDFRANLDDDPKRVEFWLENTIRGHNISLVEDTSICGTEREGYMGVLSRGILKEIYQPAKRKEFFKLKQGRMSVTEYEEEFVRLSKYARECISSEAIMCKRFQDGLNEDI